MARLTSLFFGLMAAVFVSASPTKRSLQPDNLLGEIIDALGIGLVTQINATITLDTLVTNLLSINFEAQNPLFFELTLDSVSSTAGINDTVYATFNHTFATPVVLLHLWISSPLGFLDLINVDVNLRALTIDGKLGIPLVISGLHQKNVSTSCVPVQLPNSMYFSDAVLRYNLDLS
ncbi:hypothetical protein MVEN_01473200 [Mycena venus]|uniref:Uncharacterized protein n=1 Tax=Mycena venus TaxID=2733690 RepID=A0A8H7CR69_9AGAR|nr:hypothetical protein MVEN_01473200 [Mycena venus]